MNEGKKTKDSGSADTGGRYHPLALLSIKISKVACIGYLFALATAILSIPPLYLYFPFIIAALMIALNMAGLGIAAYGMIRHRLWIDFSIALLYNAIPLLIVFIIASYPYQRAH